MVNSGYIVTMFVKKTAKKELTDLEKVDILKEILTPKKYITFKEKQRKVINVIKKTTTIEDGILKYNSCDRYLEFTCMLLETYYDIKIEEDTYDRLSSEGIIDYLIYLIDDEYKMFTTILDSYMSDLEAGKLSLERL